MGDSWDRTICIKAFFESNYLSLVYVVALFNLKQVYNQFNFDSTNCFQVIDVELSGISAEMTLGTRHGSS